MFDLQRMHMQFRMIMKADVCMHKLDLASVPRNYPFLFSSLSPWILLFILILLILSPSLSFLLYSFFLFSFFLPSSFPVSDSNAICHISLHFHLIHTVMWNHKMKMKNMYAVCNFNKYLLEYFLSTSFHFFSVSSATFISSSSCVLGSYPSKTLTFFPTYLFSPTCLFAFLDFFYKILISSASSNPFPVHLFTSLFSYFSSLLYLSSDFYVSMHIINASSKTCHNLLICPISHAVSCLKKKSKKIIFE